MTHTLEQILNKPNDFKVCKKCKSFNWYEKEECWSCYSKEFYKRTKEFVWKELNYLIENYDYSLDYAKGTVFET